MSLRTKIFLTGATGYIGGACLQHLVSDGDFLITVLVRDAEKARRLNGLGVATIVGSLDDSETLASAAAAADVVFHTADADHMSAIQSIIRGLRSRFVETKEVGILVHTSGTGTLRDDARGMFKSDVIYHDDRVEEIESLPPTADHRDVDLEIVKADQSGCIRSYIVVPSTIWGILTGPLVDMGIAHSHSQQMPNAIKASISRGQGGMVGKGLNVWPHVEINELVDMYMLILRSALKDEAPHGREGYYFGVNGEYQLLDAARAYTAKLHALGMSQTADPITWSKEDVDKYLGGSEYAGSNSRARGVRARALGWKPVKGNAEFYKGIEDEVESIVRDIK
ncbi:NAD-P-binding protein [Peniophora sp. CONT]|nr:NAD-P-binding protein [Peniophora sp. CONT]